MLKSFKRKGAGIVQNTTTICDNLRRLSDTPHIYAVAQQHCRPPPRCRSVCCSPSAVRAPPQLQAQAGHSPCWLCRVHCDWLLYVCMAVRAVWRVALRCVIRNYAEDCGARKRWSGGVQQHGGATLNILVQARRICCSLGCTCYFPAFCYCCHSRIRERNSMLGVSVLFGSTTPELGDVKGIPWARKRQRHSALASACAAGDTLDCRTCETISQWPCDHTCII